MKSMILWSLLVCALLVVYTNAETVDEEMRREWDVVRDNFYGVLDARKRSKVNLTKEVKDEILRKFGKYQPLYLVRKITFIDPCHPGKLLTVPIFERNCVNEPPGPEGETLLQKNSRYFFELKDNEERIKRIISKNHPDIIPDVVVEAYEALKKFEGYSKEYLKTHVTFIDDPCHTNNGRVLKFPIWTSESKTWSIDELKKCVNDPFGPGK